MPHVDEGQLHEYLDRLERVAGAAETAGPAEAAGRREIEEHLAGCAECRARLEEVYQVRERASAILRGSGPRDTSAPPFEEILARRAARARRRTVFRMNRLTAVGWAATIVLAVGVGWIARSSLEWGEPAPSDGRIPAVAPMTVRAPATDSAAAIPSDPAATRSGIRAQTEPDLVAPAEPAAAPLAEEVSDVAAGAGVANAAVAGPPAGEAVQEQRPAPEAFKVAEPEAAAGVVPLGRRDSAAETRPDAERVERLRREREDAAARDVAAAFRALEAPAPLQQAQTVEWTPATEEEVERTLGRTPLVIPELPVRAMAVGTLGNRPAVRVQHELSSGVTLTLVEWRDLRPRAEAGAEILAPMMIAAPDTAAPGSAGQAVVVGRDGYVLLVWAPVPRDSLLALAERVR